MNGEVPKILPEELFETWEGTGSAESIKRMFTHTNADQHECLQIHLANQHLRQLAVLKCRPMQYELCQIPVATSEEFDGRPVVVWIADPSNSWAEVELHEEARLTTSFEGVEIPIAPGTANSCSGMTISNVSSALHDRRLSARVNSHSPQGQCVPGPCSGVLDLKNLSLGARVDRRHRSRGQGKECDDSREGELEQQPNKIRGIWFDDLWNAERLRNRTVASTFQRDGQMSAAPWSAEGGPDIAWATRTLAPAPVSVGEEGDINSEEHIAGDAPPTGTDVIQLGPEGVVCEPSGGTMKYPRKDLAKDGVGKLANTTQQRVQLGEVLASCRISGPCESDKAVGGDFHRYCFGVLSGRGFIVGGIYSEKLDGKRGQKHS
ncbi:hypothetical protein B0H16DRAFT_1687884 [Mycena metata]|uniref:Uncharacterized protein n=1 Tax=Mycena metata TaxID=1033252 RepID=A0AAD7JH93_9AGAR|nr:hypothetical protein B0H16DRAFT_1687884 [Mycena metata]